ncbi:hypothetical protein KJI95_04565 [Shewanella sp. JM162201]|uniref:DUF7305 domain-containing protein n=1 Tax=Shewanella jiangmenensis TaxID=2837387 RepID=A0ABS5V032_9GAMM|nr:pilus assembly PilX N-terminal domain-containing protein [Shewanella jiangmenensis]MBT1443800.1 hypothetical protein [Shewanella jiangmenensis]
MRQTVHPSRERGAVLLVVLVFSIMATLLVVTNLKDNIVQERAAGNFQKQLNARYTAEQGMYESYNKIKAKLKTHPNSTVDILKGELPGRANGAIKGSHFETSNHRIPAPGLLMLASRGHHLEGAAGLNVAFALLGQPGNDIYKDAVVACDGLTLNGSGTIDSYDSSKGAYGDNNKGKNGDVATIRPDADVTLTGDAPIRGDVRATGNITTTGTSPISGNVHATKNVTIQGGAVASNRVGGNVMSGGNFNLDNGNVAGSVKANGNATLGGGASIMSNDLLYGGQGTFADSEDKKYLQPGYKGNPNVQEVATGTCDPIGMPGLVGKFTGASQSLTVSSTQILNLQPQTNSYDSHNGWKPPTLTSSNADILGHSGPVYRFDDLKVNSDGKLNISGGDVTLIVSGDFTLTGDAKVNIASDSSLTIVVKGKTELSGSKIFDSATVNGAGIRDNGKVSMSLFSAYNLKDGVILSGAANMYASIYAPLTDVKLTGSGDLLGSVRGKTVTASGAGAIHYDEALGLADLGDEHARPPVLALRDWLWL